MKLLEAGCRNVNIDKYHNCININIVSTRVQEKKLEKSKAKTVETLASGRLIGAAHRDADYEILRGLMFELEKVYDDFRL